MKPSTLAPFFIAACLTFAGGPAMAHDDATLDTMTAPNGGQLRMAGPYHFELVVDRTASGAADAPVYVYLSDHAGNPQPAKGVTGTAILLSPKGKASVPLAADGESRLKGMGKYAADPALKAVVSLKFADGSTGQARFEPLAHDATQHHMH